MAKWTWLGLSAGRAVSGIASRSSVRARCRRVDSSVDRIDEGLYKLSVEETFPMQTMRLVALSLTALLIGCDDIGAEFAKCEMVNSKEIRMPGVMGDPYGSGVEMCMRAKGYEYKADSTMCSKDAAGLYSPRCYHPWHFWSDWLR